MVLKMTSEQFKALHKVFATIMAAKPGDMTESLLKDLLTPIYTKLDRRVNSYMDGKRGWDLSLTPIQAKTYYVFFENFDLRPNWPYEHILIQRHLGEINKIFA
jgi:hypothetical protein